MSRLEPYDDGRWSEADNPPVDTGTLWCRGNTGEVFPNVMTPLTRSLYVPQIDLGQAGILHRMGMITTAQKQAVAERSAALTAVFAGYLYGNVTLARTAAVRAPGMTVEMIDEQMFGLHGAPPHERQQGEMDFPAMARSAAMIGRLLLRRPNASGLEVDRRDVAAYERTMVDVGSASERDLLRSADSVRPWIERMMANLLERSALSGIGRALLEDVVSGDVDLVNRLTAGLGTIESAEPPKALWDLGRTVAGDPRLTALFDEGLDNLDVRLRADGAAAGFVAELDDFRARHGARGPDEWELASPTWGSAPMIALAMIDRLRHAPPERDPSLVGARLADEADELSRRTRRDLSRLKRPAYDRALRAAVAYASQREGTKAAFVRALHPARLALAELARRSPWDHDDFFLLKIEEVEAGLADPDGCADVIAERRARRDRLQEVAPPFWFQEPLPDPNEWSRRVDQSKPDDAPRTLTGMAVCPGVATGPARIVTDPSDPRGIEPGDILVAPLTDPSWTPLFLAAAGVVVDVGAQQSHAAIVARELGIPAVVSVDGASTTIPDGAQITVDGSAGTVRLA